MTQRHEWVGLGGTSCPEDPRGKSDRGQERCHGHECHRVDARHGQRHAAAHCGGDAGVVRARRTGSSPPRSWSVCLMRGRRLTDAWRLGSVELGEGAPIQRGQSQRFEVSGPRPRPRSPDEFVLGGRISIDLNFTG